jgi:hypothetical protein
VYLGVDGIYFNVRLEGGKQYLLVTIGSGEGWPQGVGGQPGQLPGNLAVL